jgi:colanic acid/amylovoran biosynthesis glycosyltransferase
MSKLQQTHRIAYLISRYPAVSHVFILREVLQLRRAGIIVETASINLPDMLQASMPMDERAEAARTYYVKRDGWSGALIAHLIVLITRPASWLRGLFYAFTLSGGNPRTLLLGLAYFTEALMVGRWMRAQELRHLHIHFATAAANVGLYVKCVFGTTLSLTVHGPDEFDNVGAQWLTEKIVAADFIFCIGLYARSQLMRLSEQKQWSKFDISPLGVDPMRFCPQRRVVRTGIFHILCVGRLTPAKGQHILIAAACLLRNAGRQFRISMVGAGPDAESLKLAANAACLSGIIEFTGALNQTEVHHLYTQADAFVLPSFAEGIPVVLMEAMACGIPCISSRITGISELIRSDQEGFLLPPSDVPALADALAVLMDDVALRGRIGRFARARVEASYHLEKNIGQLVQLFGHRLESLS